MAEIIGENLKNSFGIYRITNLVNNKVYIGSTMKNFDIRFKSHINLLKGGKHENPILQKSWDKYGETNFRFEIILNCFDLTVDEVLSIEYDFIKQFNSLDREKGYNICKVGKSRIGTKWSEKSKKKRRGSGNPMYGKGHLVSGEKNPMYGKTLTNEHKDKMSKSLTGLKKPITGLKLSKPVGKLDINTGKLLEKYKSVKEAKEKTSIHHIGSVCNGNRASAGGFYWVWL